MSQYSAGDFVVAAAGEAVTPVAVVVAAAAVIIVAVDAVAKVVVAVAAVAAVVVVVVVVVVAAAVVAIASSELELQQARKVWVFYAAQDGDLVLPRACVFELFWLGWLGWPEELVKLMATVQAVLLPLVVFSQPLFGRPEGQLLADPSLHLIFAGQAGLVLVELLWD